MERKYERIVPGGDSHRRTGSHGSNESVEAMNGPIVDMQAGNNAVHVDEENDREEKSPLRTKSGEKVISPSDQSQRSVHSPIAFAHSSSFTFDDAFDEDEENLKRYNLDFSMDAGEATLSDSVHGGIPFRNSDDHDSTTLQLLWNSFQSQRQRARQRRAQLLLQQSERNFRQGVWICMNTYCDATDGGLLLFAFLIFVWVIKIMSLNDATAMRHWFLAGILLISLRLGVRPLSGYYTRQRQRRRLQSQDRQPHHVLPTQSPAPTKLRQRTHSNDEEDKTTPRRYRDEPPSSGNLELQSVTSSTASLT
ncbi:unnamed protein product [Cylindrotheca closterium]|uniref:Uncharacterized protein n=1 Tax=Cylindrotheca closterium TaxID=2856 RepID=A0AAD2FKY2_9STRA|nr:unnamed protein product [Cylindrotheca closterium]